MILRKIKKKNSGFVILFTVVISSILLAVALGAANIALKEVKFGTSARSTNDAFFAADTGIEYALFNDKPPSSLCDPAPCTWEEVITDLGSTGQSCAKVTVDKTTEVTTIISKGYNIGDGSCESTNPDRIERELRVAYASSSPPPPSSSWYDPWAFRKAITIDNTKVAGSGSHASFPVLVDITDANLASDAQADGDDILFTSSDGTTKLAHEIEIYTSGTGRLTAWVNVPTLSTSADTVLYMYYGNSGATNQQNITGTWNSGYKGVWHLKEGDSTGANFYRDSTSNANHMTLVDTDGDSVQAVGKVGFGVSQTDEADVFSRAANTYSNDVGDNLTWSGWVKSSTVTGINREIFGYGGSGAIAGNWQVRLTGTNNSNLTFVSFPDGGSQSTVSAAYSQITDTTWKHLVIKRNSSTGAVAFFVNDSKQSGTGQTGQMNDATATRALQLGDSTNAVMQGFAGVLDEWRISNIERSDDWISTEYNNQNSPSTFYTIGSQETP